MSTQLEVRSLAQPAEVSDKVHYDTLRFEPTPPRKDHNIMTKRSTGWFTRLVDRWLDRITANDGRYACGVCDSSFADREAGIVHLLRCHPEFDRVAVFEGPAVVSSPSRVRPTLSPVPAIG